MRRRELLWLALPLFWTAGCGSPSRDFTDPAHPIAAHVGQGFRIALDSNPTTGYTWRLAASLPVAVVLVDSRYFHGPGAAHLMGAGGREVWTFQAIRPGHGEIRLEYARPGGPAGRTATFTVRVN